MHKEIPNSCLQRLMRARLQRRRERKPSFSILSMNYQRRWYLFFAIDKENYQLTTALLSSMVGTGAIWMGEAGNLQIESWHDPQAGARQIRADPFSHLFTTFT